jgi:hypothetical protein
MNAMTIADTSVNTVFKVSYPAASADVAATKVLRFGVYVSGSTTK